jgi:hypothetical protein
MNLTLNLSSTELDNEDLQALTRQLCDSIADETDIKAEIPQDNAVQNARGNLQVWAEIALEFFNSGGAGALFAMLGVYFSRVPSLKIKATKPDGTSLEITSKNVKLEDLQSFLEQLKNPPH